MPEKISWRILAINSGWLWHKVMYGNSAAPDVHHTLLSDRSCSGRIAVLCDFLHSAALSITVPLSVLYYLFSVPSAFGLLTGLEFWYPYGCLAFVEMFSLPSLWPAVLLLCPSKRPEENWATTHSVQVEGCVFKLVVQQFTEGTERQGKKSPVC